MSKQEAWTMRDTEKIIELVQAIGPQWVTVAEQFTNKTPQACETWWTFLDNLHTKPKHRLGCKPRKKRFRRKACEIDRPYVCIVKNCNRAYGTEGALKMHLKSKHPGVDYKPTRITPFAMNTYQFGSQNTPQRLYLHDHKTPEPKHAIQCIYVQKATVHTSSPPRTKRQRVTHNKDPSGLPPRKKAKRAESEAEAAATLTSFSGTNDGVPPEPDDRTLPPLLEVLPYLSGLPKPSPRPPSGLNQFVYSNGARNDFTGVM